MRLGGHQSLSERGGVEKNSQPLPGLEPPDHSVGVDSKRVSFCLPYISVKFMRWGQLTRVSNRFVSDPQQWVFRYRHQ